VARDATARLYDVDANLVVMDKQAGTIAFQAKKKRLVNLDQLHESIRCTRLGDNTGMTLKWLDVTAEGEVVVDAKEVKLKIPGTEHFFLLGDDDTVRPVPEKTAGKRLREALDRGEKVVSVTGRLENWKGNLTQLSKLLPDKPRKILVKDFRTAKP